MIAKVGVSHRLDVWSRKAVHAQRIANFAAVVQVMLDDVPDNPAARVRIYFAFRLILENYLQIGRREAYQRLMHHLPGDRQSVHQLTGRARWTTGFFPIGDSTEGVI